MKTNRNYYEDDFDYEMDDDRKKKSKASAINQRQRREIKNWKKVWSEHTADYDEIDDFHVRR